MSHEKRQELIDRYNTLVDKYNSTESMTLKGYYAGEMVVIENILDAKKGAK